MKHLLEGLQKPSQHVEMFCDKVPDKFATSRRNGIWAA